MPKRGPTIADEAARIIREAGSVVEHESLVAQMVALGRTKATDPMQAVAAALDQKPAFVRLPDGSWTHVGVLLDGCTLLHEVTREEVDGRWLALDPDLSPLGVLLDRRPKLGPKIADLWSRWEEDVPIDPERPWRRFVLGVDELARAHPGDTVEARLAEGRVTFAPVGSAADRPIADDDALVERLTLAARQLGWLRADPYVPGVPAHGIFARALASIPRADRPKRFRLASLFGRAGLESHGAYVSALGADWSAWEAEQLDAYAGMLAWDDADIGDLEDDDGYDDADLDDDRARSDGNGVLVELDRRSGRESSVAVRFRLRIELEEMSPPVWRLIEVPGSISLSRLHRVLLGAMGWLGGHLHEFRIDGVDYGPPDEDWDTETRDDRRVRLEHVAGRDTVLEYVYDFGDGWHHVIEVVGIEPAPSPDDRRPHCLDGSGACPPEDCGGPWGYDELRRALTRPRAARHSEAVESLGRDFDPAAFDVARADALVGRVR
jgi:hypothetical protein